MAHANSSPIIEGCSIIVPLAQWMSSLQRLLPPPLCFIKIKCDTVHELTPLPHPRQVANIPLPYEIFSTH